MNANFKFDLIKPYVKRQERKHIMPVIGRELYSKWAENEPTTGPAKEIFSLLVEGSANLGMLAYTKVAIVSISNTGFLISDSEHAKPAEWWQIKDMRRELMQSGMEAIDEALALLEANQENFPEWISSGGSTSFKEFFVRSTPDFQRYHNIENSRLTFLRLKPHLLKVENKYFKGLLGMETVSQIKSGTSPEEKEALQLCQAAQVPLVVAEIAHEGTFLLTPKGLFYEIDEIPGEKKFRVEEPELRKIHEAKLEEGNEQLKALVEHLRRYPDVFTHFAQKEENKHQNSTYNTKSIISF